MSLKLKLKPKEKVIIGGAVLINGGSHAEFSVENRVPILRSKDIMTEEQADSHCKKIYFLLQLMYIEQKRSQEHYNMYLKLVKELISAAPSMVSMLYEVSESLLEDDFYKALKRAKKLIAYESEAMDRARDSLLGAGV